MNTIWSKHWTVIVYVAGLIFVGGLTFADNEKQNETLAQHTAELAKDDERQLKEAIAAAVLKADVEDIKEDVDEIKEDVKSILKELRSE